jgi:hypothetical protein
VDCASDKDDGEGDDEGDDEGDADPRARDDEVADALGEAVADAVADALAEVVGQGVADCDGDSAGEVANSFAFSWGVWLSLSSEQAVRVPNSRTREAAAIERRALSKRIIFPDCPRVGFPNGAGWPGPRPACGRTGR